MRLGSDPVLQNDVVHTPGSAAPRGNLAVGSCYICGGSLVVADPGDTADPPPVSQLPIEAAIPSAGCAACDCTAHNGPIGIDRIVPHHARMRKWLPIVKAVGMGVKKVVGRGHRFIPGWRIKMAGLDVEPIADRQIGFQIGLWKRNAVSAGRRTAQIQIPVPPVQRLPGIHIKWGNTESLGIDCVGAKHEIEAAAQVKSFAFGDYSALDVYIELIQLKPICPVGESNSTVISVGRITRIICSAGIDPAARPYTLFL